MKRTCSLAGIVTLIVGLSAHGTAAQPRLTVDAALVTHFVNRGELVVDAPVLQTELDIALGGLSFNVWGNLDLTDENDRLLEMTEVALTLGYGFELDRLDLSAGLTQYLYPDETGTREVYLHAAMDMPLNPAVGLYYDFDRIKGIYADVSAHHAVAFSRSVELELRTALGYGDAAANDDAFGYDKGALRDLSLGCSLNFMLDVNTTLSVGGLLWTLVDPDLRDTVADDGGIIWRAAFNRRF